MPAKWNALFSARNFENGIDIAGNVVVNDDLLINDNARLYLDQNSSGIFSGFSYVFFVCLYFEAF
jgi:hypothetical protein